MAMRAFGREGMEERIREHCRLAELFAGWVEREPYYTTAAPVTMAVVCFRIEPPGLSEERCDLLNEQVVEAVIHFLYRWPHLGRERSKRNGINLSNPGSNLEPALPGRPFPLTN